MRRFESSLPPVGRRLGRTDRLTRRSQTFHVALGDTVPRVWVVPHVALRATGFARHVGNCAQPSGALCSIVKLVATARQFSVITEQMLVLVDFVGSAYLRELRSRPPANEK